MKNTFNDLNNYLFESIERVMDDDLDEAGLEIELKRAKAVSDIATSVVKNGELSLNILKHAAEYGYMNEKAQAESIKQLGVDLDGS